MNSDEMENDSQSFESDLEEQLLETLESERRQGSRLPKPDELFIFPIVRRPFFPGMAAPVVIEPGQFYEALKQIARSDQKSVGLVLTKNEQTDVYKATFGDLHQVGVSARLLRIIPLEQGGAQVILNMEQRIKIEKPLQKNDGLRARVSYFEEESDLSSELKAYAISIISTIKDLLKLNPLFKEELQIFLGHSDFTEPGKLADFAVALTTATREELQDILETFDLQKRIEKALVLLKKELDVSMLQNSINQKIETAIAKSQKDFFLREQLKTIKKELGIERDDKSLDREKFETRLKERKVPADVLKVIQDELDKLSILEVQSAEYNVVRNYLDWLTIVPWGIFSSESHQLDVAEQVLDEDHYGLEEIKKRILELIGVGKLTKGLKGSIVCLVGPPGVGKTSIGKSIARALNRKFYRFSVGGMRDEAEIKGHRRTYIGAMPGKLIQAFKTAQTMNPVIMLDEIDKIGNSYHGDPASALLEVLDPEQNSDFLDHYLDVRCDLSNVLFIVTANVLDTIPPALRDRMEILRLSGYILEEKVEIAKRYLIPRNRKAMGLKSKHVTFTDQAIRTIINGYAREAGVRTLENEIKKILRKVALQVARGQEKYEIEKKAAEEQLANASKKGKKAALNHVEAIEPPQFSFRITPQNLKEYLGKPLFTSDRIYSRTPSGVCTGLAWTAMGGAILYIETTKVASEKTEMKLTGQLGSVMQESSQIAWSYLHSHIHTYAPGYTFFERSQVHIHVPEGATPKDGPSAGITIVTALISLLTDNPIKDNLGMTGELTLIGHVLPIGGVKEKVVAARRAGLKELIFPKENQRDVDELPDHVKKGLLFHFVSEYNDVYKIAFSS